MSSVLLFTPLPVEHERYAALRKSKKWRLDAREREAFKKLKGGATLELCYIDLSGAQESEVDAIVRSLLRRRLPNIGIGIIDPEGRIADPARLFHRGFIDYVGPALNNGELSPKRLESVMEYAAERQGRVEGGAAPARSGAATQPARSGSSYGPVVPEGPEAWPQSTPPSPINRVAGWDEIERSYEYTFWMLYVELDNPEAYRRTAGDDQASGIFDAFKSVVERYVDDFNGRIWIWKEAGGVVLFPFDGQSPGAVVTAVRLVLNRAIINVEDIPIRGSVSYRVALHLGNTLYEKKGRTGNIVSDAVNLLFHLGQRYTAPGTLSMTEQAAHFVSTGLVPYFSDAGVFEGVHIYRMRPCDRSETGKNASESSA